MILTRSKLTEFLGNVIIVLFPLTTALYTITPIDIAGKNAYLFFVYFAGAIILLVNYHVLLKNRLTIFSILLLVLSITILLVRTIIFEQSLVEIFENRIILTFPLFFLVAYCVGQLNVSSTKNSLLMLITLIAILGIIRSFFFPTLFIGEGVERGVVAILEEGATVREFSILGSANLYGIMLCMGLYYIGFKCLDSSYKVQYLTIFSVIFIAVFLSDSRYPALIAIIFFIMIFMKRNLHWYQIALIFAVPVAFITLVLGNFEGIINRFIEGDQSARIIKVQLSLELLFQSIESILIGVSFPAVANASFESITISDNSVLAVGMASGVFIMLLHIILIFLLIWKSRDRVAISLLSIPFLLYNAIYWDVFVFYISLLYVWYYKKRSLISLPNNNMGSSRKVIEI